MNARQLLKTYGPAALVTGASDGIGEAFARELAKAGFDLVISARRADRLEALAGALRADHGVTITPLALDLTETGASRALLDAATAQDAGLFVACAGFGTSGPFLNADVDSELAMIDLNCRAVTEQAHLIGRHLVARGRGGMILMGSLLGFQGVGRAANYAATKAFVQVLAEGLRIELGPQGVDVLACAPGPVRSGFADRADMQMGAAVPARRVPRPSLRALGGRTTARPGLFTKLLSYSLAALPRGARSRILSGAMTDMTRHQDEPG